MGIRTLMGGVSAAVVIALAWDFASGALVAAPATCEALGQMTIANGTVLSAESVQPGAFAPPNATNPNAA